MKTFLIEKIEEIAFASVDVDEELWESGILDSITIVELVVEIENEFNISVPFNEIVTDHFGTVSKMINFINSKVEQ